MPITLNGTTGITTPAVTNDGAYTGDGISFANNTPANTLVTDTSGNVGIGTSSPAVQLHVSKAGSNAVRVQNTTAGAYVELGRDSTSSYVEASGATSLQFWTNAAERMRIDSSGNLLVGTTSLPES